jgi:hypothetical protein
MSSDNLNFSNKPIGSIYQNLASCFMIVLGIVYMERFVKYRSVFNVTLGLSMFVAGWSWFLYNDHLNENSSIITNGSGKWWIGIIIPVVAIFTHFFFIYGAKKSSLGILLVLLLIISLITYLVYKSESCENKKESYAVNFVGLGLLFMGMMFYFAIDSNRFNMGFNNPMFRETIYNPSLVLVSFGFTLIAIGNSLK